LKKNLEALAQTPFEIIVVDNNSSDGSQEMVENDFPSVKLIKSPKNLGFGAANNLAFEKSDKDYFILLNTDAFAEPETLSKSLEIIAANPQIGLLGGKLVGRDGTLQPSQRMFPSLLNVFLQIFGLARRFPNSRFFGRAERTYADPNQKAVVDWVPGAFSVYPRAVYEKVGGFDERFFLYFEEVDLCRRIKQIGLDVVYDPSLVIVHLGGESAKNEKGEAFSTMGSQLTRINLESAFKYYEKYNGKIGAWGYYILMKSFYTLRRLNGYLQKNEAKIKSSDLELHLLKEAYRCFKT
jgi:GT2 family glycosyltransferase